jgi:succinate dehydrogenase/fumarate reductase flavoprotein subunit
LGNRASAIDTSSWSQERFFYPSGRPACFRSRQRISEFARTYLGIEPYTAPVPIQPSVHYAMGGMPTDVHGGVHPARCCG